QLLPPHPLLCSTPRTGLFDENVRLDDERLSVPPATRFAQPARDTRSRTAIQGNHPEIVVHLTEDDEVILRLHDLIVVVVARPVRNGYAVGETAFAGVEIEMAVARAGAVMVRRARR